jgi:hypothetical protein
MAAQWWSGLNSILRGRDTRDQDRPDDGDSRVSHPHCCDRGRAHLWPPADVAASSGSQVAEEILWH